MQQITSCNAAAGWCRVNFSLASCETCTVTSDIYPFGSLFLDAIHLLNGFFTEPEYSRGDKSSKLLSGKVAMLPVAAHANVLDLLMDEGICIKSWALKAPANGPVPNYMYFM